MHEKYGNSYIVVKEGIGHIQKRMGSNLHIFKKSAWCKKLSDGLPVGGKGRLTDAVIDSMNHYGAAIIMVQLFVIMQLN